MNFSEPTSYKPWHRTGNTNHTPSSNFSSYNQKNFRNEGPTSEPWRRQKKFEPSGSTENKPYENKPYENKSYENKPYEKKFEKYYDNNKSFDPNTSKYDASYEKSMLAEFEDVKDISSKESPNRYSKDELLSYYSPYLRPPSTLEQIEKITSRIPFVPASLTQNTQNNQSYDDV
jgi:hypothetical protein